MTGIRALGDQLQRPSLFYRLPAPGYFELLVEIVQMCLHGVRRDEQAIGYFLVRMPGGQQREHFTFALADTQVAQRFRIDLEWPVHRPSRQPVTDPGPETGKQSAQDDNIDFRRKTSEKELDFQPLQQQRSRCHGDSIDNNESELWLHFHRRWLIAMRR